MSRFADLAAVPNERLERPATTWRPVDLTDAVNGADIPEPALLTRADGCALLYAGRTHSFSGEPESCKTWAAILGCVQVLDVGRRCLWVDYEDDARGVVSRLRALGATVDAILDRFTYIRPEEPLETRDSRVTSGGIDFADALELGPFALCVIDGVTEGMTSEGLDLMSNADVATWMRRIPRRIAATGAATVMLDHLVKNREGQGRYAIGGQHKLAGIDGAAYKFEVRRPLARAVSDPIEAAVGITVTKDRPGYVRGRSPGGAVGVLELTSWPDGTVTGAVVPASESKGPDLGLVREIGEYLDQYHGSTVRKVSEAVTGKAESIREALRWMADAGRAWVRIDRVGQSHQHTITDYGRRELGL